MNGGVIHNEVEILNGGNMNSPKRIGDRVHRKATDSTETIHRLLNYVRNKGIDWVPIPFGINGNSEEVLSYIPGEVPHSMPSWVWEPKVIEDIAVAQRKWHDATEDFDYKSGKWQLTTNTKIEVICHNDFAPYNIVFENRKFKGVIDFDLCSPGSRLWDMAYTMYRFVPVMPTDKSEENDEISPFELEEIINRIRLFIESYSMGDNRYEYKLNEIIDMISIRLERISEWTYDYAKKINSIELMKNSRMYKRHSTWVHELKKAD